ncbi:MAG: EboA domain-containing protein, partial [Methylococcales bacterium]
YSALIYKNPWPVVNFPLPAFNQMVLKSLFMGINIFNVEGLRGARNPELGRMSADYAQERLDAGRDIPESIWLAVDVSIMREAGLTAWESALASDPQQPRCQLALLGCQWQSALPDNLQRAAEVHGSFYN